MEYGTPTKSQLEKINRLAKRPLSQEEVFVFPDKMAGDMIIPDRFIQLHKSLLQVFKQDAQNGVAVMIDHPWAGFFAKPKPAYNYGRTFDAKLKRSDAENEEWALYGDHYIVRGREKDGIKTDQIIADIEDGVLFDTSIGWGTSIFECSICGNDIRDYRKCEHCPGQYYEVDNEKRLCYAIAKPPGYLMENSLVFDGAYPGAGILSHDGITIEGDGDMVIVNELKQLDHGIPLMHIYCAGKNRLISFAKRVDIERKKVLVKNINTGGEQKMDEKLIEMLEAFGIDYKEGEVKPEELFNQLAEKWSSSIQTIEGLTEVRWPLAKFSNGDVASFVGAVANHSPTPVAELDSTPEFITKEKAVEVLGKEYSADKTLALAKEGQQYREALIADALEWGVRALGNDFPADSYRQMLSEESRTVQAIEDMRNAWKKQAGDAISSGRSTDPEAGKEKTGAFPEEAFMVGR